MKEMKCFVTIFDGGTNRELYLVLYYIFVIGFGVCLEYIIKLHAHGFKQLFLHVCVIILIGSSLYTSPTKSKAHPCIEQIGSVYISYLSH